VEVCPAKSKEKSGVKAINMRPKEPDLESERNNIAFFQDLPDNDRGRIDFSTVRGVQYLQPLFEFSGACAGCGETPYLKLLSQLFGDRLLIANATGCSSIYGGNLPTTPWAVNQEGRGPVWSNSLFEDNAEFGLGFQLTAEKHRAVAYQLLQEMRSTLGADFVDDILSATQDLESEIRAQRARVGELKQRLANLNDETAMRLLSLADQLVRRSVWLVGGDGWAYDIGAGGLDHVLSMDRDVNVLVLDTEVYSNTGGQMSKCFKPSLMVMSMSHGLPSALIRSKLCSHFVKRRPIKVHRSSLPTALVSPTGSTWSMDYGSRSLRWRVGTGR
jgi:pyruvate-ferredoxin/flavodoxin oxidoreductase